MPGLWLLTGEVNLIWVSICATHELCTASVSWAPHGVQSISLVASFWQDACRAWLSIARPNCTGPA